MISYLLSGAVHEKDFTREQPMHPPKVPLKPKFTTEFTHFLHYACTWNA